MITHIRMKNFKSWKDMPEVRLAPLTGFFGTNSSGKSSLLQMLLLLKQTAERSNAEEVIFFGDEDSYVNLGDFHEVIHGHNVEEPLELTFRSIFHEPLKIRIDQKPNDYPKSVTYSVPGFKFKTVIKQKEGEFNIEDFLYKTSSNVLEIGPDKSFVFLNHKNIGQAAEVKNCYGVPESKKNRFGKILQQFSYLFEELFNDVYYLGPTRVNPRRFYQWEGDHPEHSGQCGDKTIDALLSARVRNLKTAHEAEHVPIEQRISDWLQKMHLAHSFSVHWIEIQGSNTYDVRIQKTQSNPPVTLVDMGYGLSQFLPVLVLCYYAPEGSTLILEQPGIHLHPMVQAQLADLLIEVVNERNLQILVESHSEHLLNRLQRRIAEENISVEKTALYFCRNDEGVSNIKHLKMDEFGNILNWPENFFGDEMGDLFAMTKAQSERRKNAEG